LISLIYSLDFRICIGLVDLFLLLYISHTKEHPSQKHRFKRNFLKNDLAPSVPDGKKNEKFI